MAEIDTSIYNNVGKGPDPYAAVNNALGMANAFTQRQLLQNQLQQSNMGLAADQGINAAYSDPSVLNPDGTLNSAAANRAIIAKGGGFHAAPYIANNTSIAGGQISNTNSAAAGGQDQVSNAIAAMNSIASNPNASRGDLIAEASKRVHAGLLTSQGYHSIVDNMPTNDALAVKYIKTKTGGMIPAPSQATPTVAGVNPDLTPKVVTGGDAASMARQPGGFAGSATPGAAETAANDQKIYQEDQQRSAATLGGLRSLENALPLVEKLSHENFGPGSPELAKLKGILDTAGVTDPASTSLPGRQEAGKYLLKYAQGAVSAGRSDNALSAAIGSNPNLDLTQPANLALIKKQIAMDKADAAMPFAYKQLAKPGQSWTDFKSGYYPSIDTRAFGINTMSPEERDSLYKSLGPKDSPAFQKFAKTYAVAKKAGLVNPIGDQ